MKKSTLLSSFILAASMATPLFVSNTAQAGDPHGNAYERHVYKEGYRDGYRDSRYERQHRSYPRRHGYGYGYVEHYRPYRAHGYRPHGGVDLIFRF